MAMTILEERTSHAVINIATTLKELNKNIERIAVALERQNELAGGALGFKENGGSPEDGEKTAD